MKILQFCKKTPIPPKDGESIAIHQLSKAFVDNGCSLHVYSLLTDKHKSIKNGFALKNATYSFQKINTKISIFSLLNNLLFSSQPYITERFANKYAEKKLIKILKAEQFDIIQLEGIFLGSYLKIIREYSDAKVVLRAHNIENKIWERLSKKESLLKKWYLKSFMTPRLKNFENSISRGVDCVVPISSIDQKYFDALELKTPIKTLPAAYEIKDYKKDLPNNFNIGFIGGLDWQPNYDGIKWFLELVWKKFVKQKTSANFNLAGRNFPKRLYNLQDTNLYIYGEVEDAQEFTLQNSIMIAPILSGSGMRIKIIEAMALGRTVLSTSIGAEGIDYENNKNIFIADTPEEWIAILIKLSENKEILKTTALNAQALIKKEHDINKLGTELIHFYKQELF